VIKKYVPTACSRLNAVRVGREWADDEACPSRPDAHSACS
jgi:hypothetical protein